MTFKIIDYMAYLEVFCGALWLEVNSNFDMKNHMSTTLIINRLSVVQVDRWTILKIVTDS